MPDFKSMPLCDMLGGRRFDCACGHTHGANLRAFVTGKGVIARLPELLSACGARRPLIVCDENTRAAAMKRVLAVMPKGAENDVISLGAGRIEPDERPVGLITMSLRPEHDFILAVGSGVVNDCCKIAAFAGRRGSGVVATAPSMDGYASNSGAMIKEGVKVSLYTNCPEFVLADTDILATAPDRMLRAGLGDMLAKYVALAEWRITNIARGEYYCENVAGLVRGSLRRCVDGADGLMRREPEALSAVTEGLVLSGVAMAFAGTSRPASGLEHYFSHVWEMRALQRGEASDLHGIQVGVGTLITLRLLWKLYDTVPDREKAERAFAAFDEAEWENLLRSRLGAAGEQMLRNEKEKYRWQSREAWKARLDNLLARWDEVRAAIAEELPPYDECLVLMRRVGCPLTPGEIGISERETLDAYFISRSLRDKYITSSILWDLGLLESPEMLSCL